MHEEHLEISQQPRQALGRLLLENLHLAAALLAATALGLGIAGLLLPVPEEVQETLLRLDQTRVLVEQALQSDAGSTLAEEARERAERVTALWAPPEGDAPSVTDVMWPPGLLAMARSGEPNEIRFLAPRDLVAEAGRGRVLLRWVEDADSNVPLVGFVILRGAAGAEPTEVGRVEAGATSYEDRDVVSGVTYVYRVAGLTADPGIVAQGMSQSPASSPAMVEAISDVRLTLTAADPEAALASFLIEKWHRDAWWSKTFEVAVGQTVGTPDPGTGVDFSTGRRLASLEVQEGSVTRPSREVVFDPDGRVLVQGGNPVTEEIQITEAFVEYVVALEGPSVPRATLSLREKR
jgi:hypothetical protein